MKKSKLFLLSGLAMLTMAFAMSCSNPAGGDTTPAPTPKPEVPTVDVVKFVSDKVFKDGVENGESTYAYNADGKTLIMTLKNGDKFTYTYEVEGNVINLKSDAGWNSKNELSYTFIVKDGTTVALTSKTEGIPSTVLTLDIVETVKGKQFIDDTNSIYAYADDGKTYTMTLNSDKSVYNYEYTLDAETKVIKNTSKKGYGDINAFDYGYGIDESGNIKLTLKSETAGAPATMTLKPYVKK